MSRIPTYAVDDAPEASRPILQQIAKASPTGRPLNLHAQLAHSPAALASYAALRGVIAEHGTLDPKATWALNVTTAAVVGNDYMIGIASRFARMNGWTDAQIDALLRGTTTGDARIDSLTRVARQAASHAGHVDDETWNTALQSGWSDTQLTEAFAHLGLTVFTGYFLNFAQTEADA